MRGLEFLGHTMSEEALETLTLTGPIKDKKGIEKNRIIYLKNLSKCKWEIRIIVKGLKFEVSSIAKELTHK